MPFSVTHPRTRSSLAASARRSARVTHEFWRRFIPTESPPTRGFNLRTPTESPPTRGFDLRTPTESPPTRGFDLRTPTESPPTRGSDLRRGADHPPPYAYASETAPSFGLPNGFWCKTRFIFWRPCRGEWHSPPHIPGHAIIRPHEGRLMGRMPFAPTPGTWPNFATVPMCWGYV